MCTFLVTAGEHYAQAENYTVRITTESEVPVDGVEVFGTHGVNTQPGRFTNLEGVWSVETGELVFSQPTLVFSKSPYRFEPSEITLNLESCPGRVCNVKAINDGQVGTVVHWTVMNSRGQPEVGIPVTASGVDAPCIKNTDPDGYVLFAAKKQNNQCNDSDVSTENNFIRVIPHEPSNMSCTFTNRLIQGHRVCTLDGSARGYSTATCTPVSPLTVGASVSYDILVYGENGLGVSGVSFYGNEGVMNLPNRATNSTGYWHLSTNEIGVSPQAKVTLVPQGLGYQFYPASITLSPNSCPENQCKIFAFKNGNAQGVLRWKVRESGQVIGGVKIGSASPYSCSGGLAQVSDSNGEVYFPTFVRTSCSVQDLISYNPSRPGCEFSHNSGTPFQICATAGYIAADLNAQCSNPLPEQFTVSGKVFNLEGDPLEGARILDNGSQIATTNVLGKYNILVDQSTSFKLKAEKENLLFDPNLLSLTNISSSYNNINFYALAPNLSVNRIPPLTSPCGVKSEYEIKGTVFDIQGNRLPGAEVYKNHILVGLANENGEYSILVPALSNNWITTEFEDRRFDPAGISYPRLSCDQKDTHFRQTELPSWVLSGKVVDPTNYPILGARLALSYQNNVRYADTNEFGEYLLTVPDGVEYILQAEKDNLTFDPVLYTGEAENNLLNLNFVSVETVRPTPTPTLTPTETATFTPSRTPTLTNTPTITRTPTSTYTPSFTSTPTKTATWTPTHTSTKTSNPSWTPTIQQTIAVTATFTPTPTKTEENVATLVPTRSTTSAATSTITPSASPSSTVTPMATSTNTIAASPTATSVSPTLNPTSTSTPINTPTLTRTNLAGVTPSKTCNPTVTNITLPTIVQTQVPTGTASPTPTINQRLVLTSMCSEDPTVLLRWRVTNTFSEAKTVDWDVVGTNMKGKITVESLGIAYFLTSTVPNNPNTVRIYNHGKQVDVKASGFTKCEEVTPTPTATPVNTITGVPTLGPTAIVTTIPTTIATVIPTQTSSPQQSPTTVPTIQVTVAPTQTPTPQNTPLIGVTLAPTITPQPSATYTPTATSTPTSTQIPEYEVSGALKNLSGKPLTEKDMKRLSGMRLKVIARKLNGTKETFEVSLNTPFEYSMKLPYGFYNISLDGNKEITVASKPKKYALWITSEQPNLFFAVRPKRDRLAGDNTEKKL